MMRKLLLLLPLLLLCAIPARGQTVQCQTTNGGWGPCPLNASVQLFNVVAATGTATATAQKVYNFSMSGNLIVTWAGITGSPSGCTLQVKSGDSLGDLINNGSAIAVTPSNGTTSTVFTPATTQQTADQITTVYSCSVYPGAGTLSLEFVPSTISMPLDANGNLKINVAAFSSSTALDTNLKNLAGTSLGAPSAYGTPPGAVNVPGVNAFVTNVPEVYPATEASTTNTGLTFALQSAASTNSTSVKGSAGNIYGIYIINTTTTNYFLRMYNSSSAPTCSSATGFIETIPALGGAVNGGGIARIQVAQGYTTGIGFCLTGGGSSTDNTNAATGVYVTILYK